MEITHWSKYAVSSYSVDIIYMYLVTETCAVAFNSIYELLSCQTSYSVGHPDATLAHHRPFLMFDTLEPPLLTSNLNLNLTDGFLPLQNKYNCDVSAAQIIGTRLQANYKIIHVK